MIVCTLKCFQHAGKEAVGVCKTCSKGICAECALSTGWDIYCDSWVKESIQIRSKVRGSTITIASIVLYIIGTVEVVGSFLLLAVANTSSILPYSMGLGVGIAILVIAHFLKGGLLWSAKRKEDSPLCVFAYHI